MRWFALVPTLVLSFALAPAMSGSLQAADADQGKILAERWCTSCHVVSDTQRKGTDATPSFAAIADRAGFSADKLAFFLLDPHPIMPNFALSRAEAANLSAYIATFRRP